MEGVEFVGFFGIAGEVVPAEAVDEERDAHVEEGVDGGPAAHRPGHEVLAVLVALELLKGFVSL